MSPLYQPNPHSMDNKPKAETEKRASLAQNNDTVPIEVISHRRRSRGRELPPWLQEYWIELALILAVLIAIFLLVEPWEIRKTIFGLVEKVFGRSFGLLNTTWNALIGWFRSLTLSDATAVLLLAIVLVLALWRVRHRLLNSKWLTSHVCTRCGSNHLHRVHRKWPQRVLTLIGFPLRRYYCSQCNWRGLRVKDGHRAQRSFQRPVDNGQNPWNGVAQEG